MIDKLLLILTTIFLVSCGGQSKNQNSKEPTIRYIFDNDIYDEDNWNTPLIANFVGSSIVIQTESGSNSSSIYSNLIKDNSMLLVSSNSNDRAIPLMKSVKYLIESGRGSNASQFGNPYLILTDVLKNNSGIKYMTGGKLIFLSNFLNEPSRFKLFVKSINSIYFGLGCDPLGSNCKDFNLAMSQQAWSATINVYNKLHNKIPFVVGSIEYPIIGVFKYSKGIIREIYNRGNYKPIDKIGLGDIDSFFVGTNLANNECISGNIVLGNNRFVFKKGNGIDRYCKIKDDVNGIMTNIILYNNEVLK